jgi:hypothetical protein
MGVLCTWDNAEKTVIRYDFEGWWTWKEFHAACEQAAEMRQEVSHQVDYICITDNRFTMRLRMPAHTYVPHSHTIKPGSGILIVIGGSATMDSIFSVAPKVYLSIAVRYAFAPTVQDARTYLMKRRMAIVR